MEDSREEKMENRENGWLPRGNRISYPVSPWLFLFSSFPSTLHSPFTSGLPGIYSTRRRLQLSSKSEHFAYALLPDSLTSARC
jgi:hypothetical protein